MRQRSKNKNTLVRVFLFWYLQHMSHEIPEQELTLEQQVDLAQKLADANHRRDRLFDQYPDFDDLTVFADGSPENRKLLEDLEREAAEARKVFDEKVVNKLWLVKHLRETNKDELAKMIESMFGLEKLKY